MAALTTRDIPAAWQAGDSARASNLWTDGRTLYSYDMPIGVTTAQGRKVLIRPDRMVSMTTSHHYSKAGAYADEVVTLPGHYYCTGECEHVRYVKLEF